MMNVGLYNYFRASVILPLHNESLLTAVRPIAEHLRSHGLTIIAISRYTPMLTGVMGGQFGSLCIRAKPEECDILIDQSQIKKIAAQCNLIESQVLEAALFHEFGHFGLCAISPELAPNEHAAWHLAAISRSRFPGVMIGEKQFETVQDYCLFRSCSTQ